LIRKKISYSFLLVIIFLFVSANIVFAENELEEGLYYQLIDPAGTIVHQTAHELEPGDQFINEDNAIYEVKRIENNIAYIEKIGDFDPSEFLTDNEFPQTNWYKKFFTFIFPSSATVPVEKKDGNNSLVGVYHTHDDESYKPTDGLASAPKGSGGIVKVGSRFAQEMEKKGLNVIHDKTSHYPHDATAYERSRRTAAQLVKQGTAAIFDVHRDAVPANVYALQKDGENLTKITIVLGRQNPNMKANESFAKKLKAIVDKKNPGLIKGILYAKGKYNQDLYPNLLLLEVGAHTNSRNAAEKSVSILSDSIPQLIGTTTGGGTGGGGGGTTTAERRGIGKALGWIIGLSVLGGGAFLLLNSGSFSEVTSRIKRFRSTELASFLGKNSKNSTPKNEENNDSKE